MLRRSLTRFIFFLGSLLLLSISLPAFAQLAPCSFYGNLYVNNIIWTNGGSDHRITLDVVRMVNEQEVPIAQGVAEFFMRDAVQNTYSLKFSYDDGDADAIHSGDICLIYVDGVLSSTRPVVARGWNNVDIYIITGVTVTDVVGDSD